MRRAQGTLNANKGKLEADFAPESRQDGLKAIDQLDAALKDFATTVDANDKQVIEEYSQFQCAFESHRSSCTWR